MKKSQPHDSSMKKKPSSRRFLVKPPSLRPTESARSPRDRSPVLGMVLGLFGKYHGNIQKMNQRLATTATMDVWLVVWLPFFMFPYIGLLSSSQMTNSYFSEGWPNHQPAIMVTSQQFLYPKFQFGFQFKPPTSYNGCPFQEAFARLAILPSRCWEMIPELFDCRER